jgi:hypothetical protein
MHFSYLSTSFYIPAEKKCLLVVEARNAPSPSPHRRYEILFLALLPYFTEEMSISSGKGLIAYTTT